MRDLLAAFGLALAVEGLVFAAFPDAVRRMMEEAAKTPAGRMRIGGLASALAGVVIVWLARQLG